MFYDNRTIDNRSVISRIVTDKQAEYRRMQGLLQR